MRRILLLISLALAAACGDTWTKPELTELTDGRSKQCAGNLPDGRIYVIGNPIPAKDRTTLAIQWSDDGRTFSAPIPLRLQLSEGILPRQASLRILFREQRAYRRHPHQDMRDESLIPAEADRRV